MFDFQTVFFYAGVVLLCSLLAYSVEKKPDKWKVFFIIMVLAIVSGFRANTVGNDTLAYYRMFETYGVYGNVREVVFKYYIKFLMTILRNPQMCMFVSSLLINGFIICGFWKIRDISSFKCNVIAYSFIPFFLTMSGLRQWIAIAIVVYYFEHVLRKKYVKFGFAVLVASLFHTSILIAFAYIAIAVFFEKNYIKKSHRTAIRFFIILASIPAGYVIVKYAMSQYSNYLDTNDAANRGGGLMNIFRVIIWTAFIVFVAFYKKSIHQKLSQTDNEGQIAIYENKLLLVNFIVLGYLFYVLSCFMGQYVQNVARIAWPFIITQGFMYGLFDESDEALAKFGIILLYILFLYHLYVTIFNSGNQLTPYLMFWQ